MNGTIVPRLGDIWKEVDPRLSRHVLVIGDHGPNNSVQIQACYRTPETIGWQTHGPRRWASISRFNGKRGGYALAIRSTVNGGQES